MISLFIRLYNIYNFYINILSTAKFTKDGEPERCKAIQKVEWKLSRSG